MDGIQELASNVNVAALGFGSAILVFRIQRELSMEEKSERTWFPRADWLIVIAMFVSAVLGLLIPLMLNQEDLRVSRIAAAASCVLFLGYVPSILAHDRIVFGANRTGERFNPEPLECWFFWTTLALAIIAAIWAGKSASPPIRQL